MCLGTADATPSFVDLSETEMFRDRADVVDGVDLGSEEAASADTARDLIEVELADGRILLSSFGGTGGIGCSGRGFSCSRSWRAWSDGFFARAPCSRYAGGRPESDPFLRRAPSTTASLY